jgi:hypothetical protein
MIERSDSFNKISEALLKAQPNIDSALKTATGHHGKYSDLLEVITVLKKPLNDVGVLIMQSVDISRKDNGDDKYILITCLMHPTSGEFFSSNTPILCAKVNDPTAFGSGLTYAKRYGLQAFGLLPSEDDDGKAAAREAAKIPDIDDDQQKVIDVICSKMPPKEGFTPDGKSIARLCYVNSVATPKTYPTDMSKAIGIVEWLLNKFKDSQLYKGV